MDVVYDSYIKNSIKYSERQRRKTVNPIFFLQFPDHLNYSESNG